MSRETRALPDRPLYRGVWAGLVRWFRVPPEPPTLPTAADEEPERFRPSPGFLRYLKLTYLATALPVALAVLAACAAVGLGSAVGAGEAVGGALGLLLAGAPLAAAGWVGLHLRYDTTWYVLTRRSLRTRRGIWRIRETTLTFENVQNVRVNQGPIQRWCGVADVALDTAAAGASSGGSSEGGSADRTVIEGVADAARIRDLVLDRVRRSRSAGLGDEEETGPVRGVRGSPGWPPEHLRVLREIREAVTALSARRGPPDREGAGPE